MRRGGAPSGAMVSAPDGQTSSQARQEVQLDSATTVDLCLTISSTAVGQALTQLAQPTHFSRFTLTRSLTAALPLSGSTGSPLAAIREGVFGFSPLRSSGSSSRARRA